MSVTTLDPPVPPLHPPVAATTRAVPEAAGQCESWWRETLEADQDALRDLQPPAFAAFDDAPGLQALLRDQFDAAVAWSHRSAESAGKLFRGQGPDLGSVVEQVEWDLGRRSEPFDLRVTVLPVAGSHHWVCVTGTRRHHTRVVRG
jgi:hypothetical protein